MPTKDNIPKDILKDYFDLHEEFESVIRFAPLEIFNSDTLSEASKIGTRAKLRYYIYACVSFLFLTTCLLLFLVFLSQLQGPSSGSNNDETIRLLRRNFAGTIFIFMGIGSVICGYLAIRYKRSIQVDSLSNLKKNALRPTLARTTYKALNSILEQRIPVCVFHKERVRNLPLYSEASKVIQNAILVLIGNDKHRQALSFDGPLPRGTLLIHRKYYDRIMEELKKAVQFGIHASRNEKDYRPLKTALLSKEHMGYCIEEMVSDAFWKNRRITSERTIAIKVSKYLYNNWAQWEVFRRFNADRSHFHAFNNENHKLHSFANELLHLCNNSKPLLLAILSGKNDTIARFFRELAAITETELVPQNEAVV